MLACSVAAYHCYFGLGSIGTQTEDVSHFCHHSLSTYRTQQAVERTCLDTSVGKAGATGESATATVGLRQDLSNLSHTWIFFYSKLLGHDKEYTGQDQCCHSQSNYCYQNCIHCYYMLIDLIVKVNSLANRFLQAKSTAK